MIYRYRHHYRRHGPPPFVRAAGCTFGFLIMLAVFGTKVITRYEGGPLAIVFGVVLLIAIATAFVWTLRRVTSVFRKQDALRRQLMADVAHELRTPLAILQGRVEGLIDGVYPRDDERLEELLGEIRHLSRLVEDLRTIANAEAGALELRKERFDLVELIRDVAGDAGVDSPEELAIDADPVRIREVMLNLLSNAKRYSDAVRIRVEARPREAVIEVSDRGKGIPAEDLPRIFERFQKGRDSRGTGLGLAIARDLVTAHGGTIHAQSVVGQGTTITITLPR